MPPVLISPKIRSELREWFVSTSLAVIANEFSNAGVECDSNHEPVAQGERRKLVEQYYHTLDFKNPDDVQKLLHVLESVLFDIEHEKGEENSKQVKRFSDLLLRDGYRFDNGRILSQRAAEVAPSLPASPDSLYAFISYSTMDKAVAGAVQKALLEYGVRSFMAHEDLKVSDEWKLRIYDELLKANVFVALLSENFKESDWTGQEVGIAYTRANDLLFIPLALDTTHSYGFIGHLQSEPIRDDPVAGLLLHPLLSKFPAIVFPRLVASVSSARSFRRAESIMGPIVEYFSLMDREVAQSFAEACIRNAQVWSANLCRTEYLPEFLRLHAAKLEAATREALVYQVEKNQWFRSSEASG